MWWAVVDNGGTALDMPHRVSLLMEQRTDGVERERNMKTNELSTFCVPGTDDMAGTLETKIPDVRRWTIN